MKLLALVVALLALVLFSVGIEPIPDKEAFWTYLDDLFALGCFLGLLVWSAFTIRINWRKTLKAGLAVALIAFVLLPAYGVYLFSPIDIVPDAVPILGLTDDLSLLAAGIYLAARLMAWALAEPQEEEKHLSEIGKMQPGRGLSELPGTGGDKSRKAPPG